MRFRVQLKQGLPACELALHPNRERLQASQLEYRFNCGIVAWSKASDLRLVETATSSWKAGRGPTVFKPEGRGWCGGVVQGCSTHVARSGDFVQ